MIKGLTPQLSEAGKIKIGGRGAERKSKSGGSYRMPVKFDHFVITKNYRDSKDDFVVDTALMDSLEKSHDGKVREIPIVLHSDDIDEIFPTAYVLYAGKKLACRGDGETAQRWQFDKKTKVRLDIVNQRPCTCDYLNADGKNKCKPHGTLHCGIAVPGLAIAGAVYKWRTTSIISINKMIGSLQAILEAVGTLKGLPLTLVVEPVQVAPQGKTITVYTCHVELRAVDLVAAQRDALEAAKVRNELCGGRPAVKMLVQAPGLDETDQEQAEIFEEFHGEGEVIDAPSPLAEKVAAQAPVEADVAEPEAAQEGGEPDYGTPDN